MAEEILIIMAETLPELSVPREAQMAVRPIRATSRYAMRLPARLTCKAAGPTLRGLLIELSMEGARISNLGNARLDSGDAVLLALDGEHKLNGTVRWAHDGLAGLKLDNPLHIRELETLLDLNDARQQQELPLPRYGT
jgi:hypothetical protein